MNGERFPTVVRDRQKASPTSLARRILQLRRRREGLLGAMLFADPAWDMLLDLLVAEEEGRDMSVATLCMAAAFSATTAQRWIGALVENGLITLEPDASDRRTVIVRLRPEASSRLRALLGEF